MTDSRTDLGERLQDALGSAYTISRELGGGGMSRVFVAEETSLGRKVVIKVLPPELAAELSAERFEREVRLAAQLQHPQIVPVLTAGDAGGVPYYTMPLVEGESLRAQLAREGPLPIPRVISVLRDVAKALEFAHARGVVHRDIKPDNVLFAGSSAAVTDFGIAKALSASKSTAAPSGTLTQLGTSLGTPAYMAPEQAAGDPDTDARADIYAFGCMAYELLTGAPPFGDKPPHQLIVAHFSETPVPVEQRRPDTPRPLANLVMRCLEKAPSARPQQASELLAELDVATTGRTTGGFGAAVSNRSTGRLVTAVAVGIGFVAVVGAMAAGLMWTHRSSQPVDEQIIAVLPFRVAGADPSLHYLREGMLDLLSARLASSSGVRSVDSRTVLAAWHRAGGDDRNDVTEEASRTIALKVGAGQILVGDIVGGGKQITVHATLASAATGKRTDASVTGAPDSLPSIVDRVTVELLAKRAGEAGRLASLSTTSLAALRPFLDGQASYRRGHWEAAATAFNVALDADTTFGLAALGVIQASRWYQQTRDVPRANRIAWRLRDSLSPRDRALLTVMLGPNYPKAERLSERGAAAERYAALAPDSPDAWYQVGDWLFHYGRGGEVENAMQRSVAAFNRALELDSSFTPALEHLPLAYAALGDSAKLRRAMSALAATDSGNALAGQRMIVAAELGDSAQVQALRATIPHMPIAPLLEIVQGARAGRIGVDDARRALQAARSVALSPFEQTQTIVFEMIFESETGHVHAANDALDKTPGAFNSTERVLSVVFWDWDSTGVGAIAQGVEADARKAMNGTPSDPSRAVIELAVVAEYHAWRGDSDALAKTADVLRRITFSNDTTGRSAERDRYQALLDAQLAAMTHRGDARVLLTRLDSIIRNDPQGALLAVGSIVAARGWEAIGDVPRALAALARADSPSEPPSFYSTLLREQGRLAALAGNRELAIRSDRQYLALRTDPDPALKPMTERVRADLQRVESQRAR